MNNKSVFTNVNNILKYFYKFNRSKIDFKTNTEIQKESDFVE
jgi:hypothetical protein